MSSIVKVDTIQENTSANGITVDGLNIKDSKLVTANSVVASNITADAIDATKIADNAISEEHLDVTSITGHTAETSIADGDTILIHDASASALRKMTKANFVSGIGGTNTPTFLVRKNGDLNISANTNTKVTGWSEIFDPQNTFASDKFTPGVSGKYFFFGYVYADGTDGARHLVRFAKNGTVFVESGQSPASDSVNYPQLASGYIDLDTDDYVEMFFLSTHVGSAFSSGTTVQFGGFKIIE